MPRPDAPDAQWAAWIRKTYPRCAVCQGYLTQGQVRAHAVCSSMLAAYPQHRPRCTAVKVKMYGRTRKSHQCILPAGHEGMHRAAAGSKQAPWL